LSASTGYWPGRVVVVTGAGQGIGRAIALRFGSLGAEVVVLDRIAETAEECAGEVAAQGGRALARACDVSDPEQVQAALAELPKVDVLINNAGIGGPGIVRGDLASWDRVITVNLRGAYIMAREVAPRMRAAGGGAMVQIASTRALQSEPDSEPYAASKAGLLGLTHALAASLGPWGIRVNAICPGWIETAEYLPFARRHHVRHRAEDEAQHWVGRVGRPEDVAAACVFLCGPDAGFITGQYLVVDGGMTRKMIYVVSAAARFA